jgi:hypothetical protein
MMMKTTMYQGIEIVRVAKGEYKAVVNGETVTGRTIKEVQVGIEMILRAMFAAQVI